MSNPDSIDSDLTIQADSAATNLEFVIFIEWKDPVHIICDSTWTIEAVKQAICDQSGIKIEDQALHDNFTGDLLEDHKTLGDYPILFQKPSIQLRVSDLVAKYFPHFDAPRQLTNDQTIYIKTLTGRTITVRCNPDWLIESLMLAIDELVQLPPHQQRYSRSNRVVPLGKTFAELGIVNDSVLYLVPPGRR